MPGGEGFYCTQRDDGTLELSYHAQEMTADAVLDPARAARIVIADMRTVQANLEDVLLNLTRSNRH